MPSCAAPTRSDAERTSRGSHARFADQHLPDQILRRDQPRRRADERRGFVNDRRWLLVDGDNRFLTQRELPRMALIQPTIEGDCLRLSAPGVGDFELPVDQPGARAAVSVWKDSGIGAVDQGDPVAAWFSDFLEYDCRLVRFADDAVRPVSPKYAPRPTDQVGFADGYPFLIIAEASLDDLNRRLDTPLPMNRFRPNIVVADAEPYAEDTWRAIRVGEVEIDVVKPCARCAITTTDQATAARGKEPLRTLATYRNQNGGAMFGQNAIHRTSGGTILDRRSKSICR